MNEREALEYIKAGILTKEQAMALTTRNLTKPGQMTVEPDTPVKPDKITKPKSVRAAVTHVQLKVGNDVQDHYLTYESMTEDAHGIYFQLAKRYFFKIVRYSKYWILMYPDSAGPVSFYHPYIVSHMTEFIDVYDNEELSDYLEQIKPSRF